MPPIPQWCDYNSEEKKKKKKKKKKFPSSACSTSVGAVWLFPAQTAAAGKHRWVACPQGMLADRRSRPQACGR